MFSFFNDQKAKLWINNEVIYQRKGDKNNDSCYEEIS